MSDISKLLLTFGCLATVSAALLFIALGLQSQPFASSSFPEDPVAQIVLNSTSYTNHTMIFMKDMGGNTSNMLLPMLFITAALIIIGAIFMIGRKGK